MIYAFIWKVCVVFLFVCFWLFFVCFMFGFVFGLFKFCLWMWIFLCVMFLYWKQIILANFFKWKLWLNIVKNVHNKLIWLSCKINFKCMVLFDKPLNCFFFIFGSTHLFGISVSLIYISFWHSLSCVWPFENKMQMDRPFNFSVCARGML
jgi:hypothetical protein